MRPRHHLKNARAPNEIEKTNRRQARTGQHQKLKLGLCRQIDDQTGIFDSAQQAIHKGSGYGCPIQWKAFKISSSTARICCPFWTEHS
jgi:hypothetical protein